MKKLFGLMGLMMLLTMVSVLGFSGAGSGTAGSPYLITTCSQLQEMKDCADNYCESYYVLANNIDCSDTVNWNAGAGFYPIGEYDYEFYANFNGRGYTISDLYINRPSTNLVGLFGATSSGLQTNVVSNVNLVNAIIIGAVNTGGLIGQCQYSGVTNSSVSGYVKGGSVGGLIGVGSSECDVSYSSFTGVVNGSNSVGGIMGNGNSGASISDSYMVGNVVGTGSNVGGLIGTGMSASIIRSHHIGNVNCGGLWCGGLAGLTLSISESYNIGDVTGANVIGGLAGNHVISISKSYAEGTITAGTGEASAGISGGCWSGGCSVTNSYFNGVVNTEAGFLGNANDMGTITITNSYSVASGMSQRGFFYDQYDNYVEVFTGCYYDYTLAQKTDDYATAKTTAEMKTQSTFSGWDFSTVWQICSGEYPTLIGVNEPCPPACVPDWVCSGYGACELGDVAPCNAVTDNNVCGESYTGNYSEFTPNSCDFCTPVWQCVGYGVCQPDDFVYCTGVNDTQVCGESYGGDMSEFKQSCSYCVESWVGSFGLCRNGQHTWSYVDVNNCGTFDDVPVDNGTVSACVEVSDNSGGGATPPKVSVVEKVVSVPQDALSGSNADTSGLARLWNKVIDFIVFWR